MCSFILRTKSSSDSKELLNFHKPLPLSEFLSNFKACGVRECWLEREAIMSVLVIDSWSMFEIKKVKFSLNITFNNDFVEM